MQNKRTFASRFFELFTSPGSLKLNTQRRSAPSMCAFKEEELCQLLASRSECKWRVQPCDSYLKERFIFFIVCLFILFYYYFFCHPHFSFFFSLLFLLSAFFFCPSAFFYPHFPIRIRHPQVSGSRFTDTRTKRLNASESLILPTIQFCYRFDLSLGLKSVDVIKHVT